MVVDFPIRLTKTKQSNNNFIIVPVLQMNVPRGWIIQNRLVGCVSIAGMESPIHNISVRGTRFHYYNIILLVIVITDKQRHLFNAEPLTTTL